MKKRVIKVENLPIKKRIDKYLKDVLVDYSREFIKVLCKNKYVKLNGRDVEPDEKVKSGDIIEIYIPQRDDVIAKEGTFNIDIIYEDDELLVINKPPFLKVHPSKNFDKEITLLDLLEKKFPGFRSDWPLKRPFLIHRLDKETSGILVIAKSPRMQLTISKQFEKRQVKKVYRSIVSGAVNVKEGDICIPIKKYKHISKVSLLGKEAQTSFKVLSKTEYFSYLEVYPKTGRTHQIRTHLSFIGHPIIGDANYGGLKEISGKEVPRIMLHAYGIEFFDPRKKLWVSFKADLPEDFCFFLSFLHLD